MGCKHCYDLCLVRAIHSGDDLAHVVSLIRDYVADATIRERLPVVRPRHPAPPFDLFVSDGPGKKPFMYVFECQHCGELFRLEGELEPKPKGQWAPEHRESRRETR